MNWFRKIKFRKVKDYVSEDTYRLVSDSDFIKFCLEKANYYQIRFVKASLDDIFECEIVFFGDKESYLKLVKDFVDRYKGRIKELSF